MDEKIETFRAGDCIGAGKPGPGGSSTGNACASSGGADAGSSGFGGALADARISGAGGRVVDALPMEDQGRVAGGSAGSSGTLPMGTGGTSGTGGRTAMAAGGNGGAGGAPWADAAPETPPNSYTGDAGGGESGSVPTLGLVAYYSCDQAQGSILRDDSGHGNHGALRIGAGAVGSGDWGYKYETGKIGNALTLVQAGAGYVSFPTSLFEGRAEMTFATWIRLNSLTMWQRIIDVGINANLQQNTMTGTVYLNLVVKDLNGKLGLNGTKNGYGGEQRITAFTMVETPWDKSVIRVLVPSLAWRMARRSRRDRQRDIDRLR